MFIMSRYLIFLLLPIYCYGCMRTPGLPETPIPVTPDPCPIPPGTAMIFIRNDVELVDSSLGKVNPEQSCATQTGKNDWYNGMTPELSDNTMVSAGTWVRTRRVEGEPDPVVVCANPCICNAVGACYAPANPASEDPAITLYPHCPTPETCFIAVVMTSDGILNLVTPPTPPNTAPPTYETMFQFDPVTFDRLPVTDPAYLRAKSIGCGGCPVVVA